MQDIPAAPLPRHLDHLPVIDLEAYGTLASVLGQDRMVQMATTFFVDADRRLTLLERDGATPADLQDHAHALVSMAGHLGLKQLSMLCMDLQERARRNGGLDGRPQMRRAIGDAQAAVQAVISGCAPVDVHAADERRAGSPLSPVAPMAFPSRMPDGATSASIAAECPA